MPKERPPSANQEWCSGVLDTLTKKSKRGGKLPTPRYIREAKQAMNGMMIKEEVVEEEEEEEVELLLTQSRRAELQKEHLLKLEQETRSFLPDVNQVLENLREQEDGLSVDEMDKVTATFNRFKDAGTVDKEQLPQAINFLGYRVDTEQCTRIADGMTELTGLEKLDFQKFVLLYKHAERARYQEVFDKFDDDGSGELDTTELVLFLKSLGFMPLRAMIKEALALVDMDGSGTLDFEECVVLLHILQHSEGFTMKEVKEFTAIFADFDPENKDAEVTVDQEQVAELLVNFFGPSVNSMALELQTEAVQAQSGEDEDENVRQTNQKPRLMKFPEALFWARRIRDKKFEQYREAFQKFDEDGSDSIDMEELQKLLCTLGFSLPLRSLEELLEKAHDEGDLLAHDEDGLESMDFDTFVHFMQILDTTEGFTDEELEGIDMAFDKFDADGSGDIDAVELSDILMYMGFSPSPNQVRRLLVKVDLNGNGILDRREFVHLFRLHREYQLDLMKAVFKELAEDGKLARVNQEYALMRILETNEDEEEADGEEGEEKTVTSHVSLDLKSFIRPDELDIDEFTELADEVVKARALKRRRLAGYTEEEVTRYKEVFDSFDTQKAGTLKAEEFNRLLTYLGFEFETLQQQQEIKAQLIAARTAAAQDGIEGAESPGVNLWILLKLLRAASRKRALETEENIKNAATDTGFTLPEINEFQVVFDKCWEDNLEYEDVGESDPSRKTIPLPAFIRLLRTMGIKLDAMRRGDLNEKILEFADEAERSDFLGFLRVMRWMMKTNFCNINGVAEVQGG
eukprot:CAMPEP_0197622536 /NCGR_PEP_ID=MMETSP1338-20131121/2801_1 /TAXON_ID=43686 ORGANISM="Pelagodinium beii, Strain RCC1491" /NCGR_SAMPLE_ID=MMETSP1338 /ASSEMBLY_ACC=CAM_ASM_000754 /LENGTH=800 /DNA_ID=CAMNT_0043192275 /DNA_START=49 /DNA_END=2451 /DNA_ORIENTATION=+